MQVWNFKLEISHFRSLFKPQIHYKFDMFCIAGKLKFKRVIKLISCISTFYNAIAVVFKRFHDLSVHYIFMKLTEWPKYCIFWISLQILQRVPEPSKNNSTALISRVLSIRVESVTAHRRFIPIPPDYIIFLRFSFHTWNTFIGILSWFMLASPWFIILQLISLTLVDHTLITTCENNTPVSS
jgi:uncharacterized membrane protein YhaH (DUF805 family)